MTLHFYDAAAPIVTKESIDFSIAFYGDRYSQEKKKEETVEEWKKRKHGIGLLSGFQSFLTNLKLLT